MDDTMNKIMVFQGLTSDQQVLIQAAKYLRQRELLKVLAIELASEDKSMFHRKMAGVWLINCLRGLVSKNVKVAGRGIQISWLQFSLEVREEIKTLVLRCLGTEQHLPMAPAAPQCVAYIASAEISVGQWQVISTLADNIASSNSSDSLKIASLDSIGYICKDVSAGFRTKCSNLISSAIIQGLRKEETSFDVRISAARALFNFLAKAKFEEETERNSIMQVVYDAAQSNCVPLIVAALQNLVRIMSLYYNYMEAYMAALFAITLEAMKYPEDDVALQAIEFWSTVCNKETELAIEEAEAMEQGQSPAQTSSYYVHAVLKDLVPILLSTLAKQDDSNSCKGAKECLSLVAICTDDSIIPHVLPFITEHITSMDWKYRDAAIMALGSIMEGPNSNELAPKVMEVVPNLITMMLDSDGSVQVKDTAAWTIGRICEHTPAAVLQPAHDGKVNPNLDLLLEALCCGLTKEPHIVANVCRIFSLLSEAASKFTSTTNMGTNVLSPYYNKITNCLVEAVKRGDANMSNLKASVFKALKDMVAYSDQECYTIVKDMALFALELQLDDTTSTAGEVIADTLDNSGQSAMVEEALCPMMDSQIKEFNLYIEKKVAESVKKLSESVYGLPPPKKHCMESRTPSPPLVNETKSCSTAPLKENSSSAKQS